MNSPPYGYGGRIAETIVFAVRIIMSPTCSNRDFAGRNALSATDLTNFSPPRRRLRRTEDYVIDPPSATPNRTVGRRIAASQRKTGA